MAIISNDDNDNGNDNDIANNKDFESEGRALETFAVSCLNIDIP